MNKRNLLAAATVAAFSLAFTTGCSTTKPEPSPSASSKRRDLDQAVDGAMTKLYNQVPGSRELVARSRGVLVFPSVISAGFVVGGSYGQGSLRSGGRTDGYYSTTAGSVGLLAGADSKAVYILFLTQDALDKFRASKGWEAGVDASVTVLKYGADAGIDTTTGKQPVVGYVLSNAGLMANLSVDGTKIQKIDL